MPILEASRRLARSVGIGRALLYSRHVRLLGPSRYAKMQWARYGLRSILTARPVDAGGGEIDVHMLLNHDRLLEGMWAYYTFFQHAGIKAQAIVHDDGTLTDVDCADLWRLLCGVRIIHRDQADVVVGAALAQRGLARCARLRETLPFARKLIDIPFFGSNDSIVLDSDVLFFQEPTALLDAPGATYSIDQWEPPCACYCVGDTDSTAILGRQIVPRFNPGVMKVGRASPDLDAVEAALSHPGFWPNGRPSYYAELTLWAMEMTRVGATPLPRGYDIAPSDFDTHLVTGHFCGGITIAHTYYTQAIPHVRARLVEH